VDSYFDAPENDPFVSDESRDAVAQKMREMIDATNDAIRAAESAQQESDLEASIMELQDKLAEIAVEMRTKFGSYDAPILRVVSSDD